MPDNIRELADTSYKSESYDEAYDYYSRLLEENPDDGKAWARKGVSAAWKSSLDNDRFKELFVSLHKAEEKGQDVEDEDTAERVFGAAKDYIDEIYSFVDQKIEDKRKESMGTGTLKSVQEFNVKTFAAAKAAEKSPEWVKAVKVMERACEISPSADRCRKAIREIDEIFAHSSEWDDYLEHYNDSEGTYKELKRIRRNLLELAKDINPNFQPEKVDTGGGSSSSGGCYIATATVGHKHHPILSTLRRFRDEHLLTNPMGQAFVSAYYAVGPSFARVIERSELLRNLSMHLVVKPLYRLASRLVSDVE
jgi:tetratricopeptide (TPR) repeat protein